MQGLQGWLDGTRELEAPFEQSLLSGAFGAGVEERGRLYVKRPGRMRWDYRDPERKVAILDGDRTWLYLEEERQVVLGRLEDEGGLLPALIAGDRALADLFEFELLDPPEGEDDGYRLRLRPLRSQETFESVVVVLGRRDYAIEAAEVLDAAGNRMLYRFGKFRRNRGLPDGMFRFEPPPGTTVVGEH